MTPSHPFGPTLPVLDEPTAALVRLSARVTSGSERAVRSALDECTRRDVPERWVEELILQSYLFAGFPRALNAAREWRRLQGASEAERSGTDSTVPAADGTAEDPSSGAGGAPRAATGTVTRTEVTETGAATRGQGAEGYEDVEAWRLRGQDTCATVYGPFYAKLRSNIRALHPALDEWMIVEGYGKVLSRAGLDLARRELCVVASCVAAGQDRQTHSHLHGARHAGAGPQTIAATLDALEGVVSVDDLMRARMLWARVAGKRDERRDASSRGRTA